MKLIGFSLLFAFFITLINADLSQSKNSNLEKRINNKLLSSIGINRTVYSSKLIPYTFTTKSAPIPTPDYGKYGRCGPKSGNRVCPNNQCCSQHGYCGYSKEYCGIGCLKSYGKCGTDFRCGEGFGLCNKTGYCCSKYGYCGNTKEYCGAGCQKSFGHCNK